ncbi:MAG: N-acetylmuramoyl-L-alanine amidase [Rhodospirillales bacterium RIFCSPLOWO2_12_FULL_58_28]|nr:MAG: N-acetylmuramoyl-L-alanine amidase [Rhodospirillales bacterium RIFCSPLOWO2_02_FULL_58_16]OHC78640.1 MAG: N-acetylmuramoyl-L-alanine amidase [Rhodospirillales bacterium RIFCSPLOWO2_12_FULL_58_28]
MKTSESPNFDARPPGARIDMLVLHYTGMVSAEAAIERLCDPAAKVSAHYLIDEDGAVRRLVDENHRAWHAGEASWRGKSDINARSLGIELVNPGHEFGYRPFPEAQMAALEALAQDILARHTIEARNVVGHSDVAPRRKTDPGELFDWRRLAEAGIGLWPDKQQAGQAADAGVMLADYGYDVTDLKMAIKAFQRRFRPRRIDGVADAETSGLLTALLHRLP